MTDVSIEPRTGGLPLDSLACPRCDGALDTAGTGLHCNGCNITFPVLGGVPWLFSEPNAALAETTRATLATGAECNYSYDQSAPTDGSSIAIGLRVRHPVFGTGTVAGVIGSGPGQKLRIQFDRAGLKTVMLRYANLELG